MGTYIYPDYFCNEGKLKFVLQEASNSTSDINDSFHAESVQDTHSDVGVQTTLTMQELDNLLHSLRREKKILQQRLRRRDEKVSNIKEMLVLLKKNDISVADTVVDMPMRNLVFIAIHFI